MGAFAQGLQWGEGQAAKQGAHKQALSDAELETNIGQANNNITALQTKLGTLDPSSRDHAETMQALQQQVQDRTALFHPANNPGAIQKFGHLLGLGRQAAPATPVAPPTISTTPSMQLGQATLPEGPARTVQGPQTPAQLKAQAQANMIAAGAATPPPGQLTPDEQHQANLISGGIAPRAAPDKSDTPLGKASMIPGHDAQGNPVMGYVENGKFVPVAGTTVPPPKAPAPSNSAFAVVLRSMFPNVTDGHYSQDQVRQALVNQKQWQTPDSESDRDAITYDANGDAHVNTLHSASHKTFGGNGGAGSPGKGGGAAAPRTLEGAHRNTPAQNKANTEVVEATKLSSVAQQVMKNPNDAINQKRLAVALERISAGRFTTQALDYIIKAGWGNTIEQWVNNPSTGALPADVVRQLVDGATQNLTAAKDAQTEAYKSATTPGDMKNKANPGGGSLADRLNKALSGGG